MGSDHHPIAITLTSRAGSPPHPVLSTKPNIRKLEDEEYLARYKTQASSHLPALIPTLQFIATVNTTPSSIVDSMDISLRECITEATATSIGFSKRRKKTSADFFITPEIRSQIHLRRDLYDSWKAGNGSYEAYVTQRCLVKKLCRTAIVQKQHDFCASLQGLGHCSKSKLLSGVLKAKRKISSDLLPNDPVSLDSYAQHFESIYTPYPFVHTKPLTTIAPLSNLDCLRMSLLSSEASLSSLVSPACVSKAIRNLPRGKAAGCSGLTAEQLIPIADQLAIPISIMFTYMTRHGICPESFCKSTIFPIPKKSHSKDIADFRPISLTEVLRRLYELCIYPALRSFIEPLHAAQNGFRSERSTLDHCLTLQYLLGSSPSPSLCVALLDIQAAYDKVDRLILWQKLVLTGCPTDLLLVLQSLFDNNSSNCLVNNERTRFFPLRSGLLQGSILSPTLYSLFINDLASALEPIGFRSRQPNLPLIPCLLYADDIALVAENPAKLQAMLNVCADLSFTNNYRFNVKKCLYMSKLPHTFTLYDQPLPKVDICTYLGLPFSLKGLHIPTWMDSVRKDFFAVTFMLSRVGYNSRGFDTLTKLLLYKTFIRPIVEYGLAIIPRRKVIDEFLDKLQNQALRHIHGFSKRTPLRSAMHRIYDLPTMSQRHEWLQGKYFLRLDFRHNLSNYAYLCTTAGITRDTFIVTGFSSNRLIHAWLTPPYPMIFPSLPILNPILDPSLPAATIVDAENSHKRLVDTSFWNDFSFIHRLVLPYYAQVQLNDILSRSSFSDLVLLTNACFWPFLFRLGLSNVERPLLMWFLNLTVGIPRSCLKCGTRLHNVSHIALCSTHLQGMTIASLCISYMHLDDVLAKSSLTRLVGLIQLSLVECLPLPTTPRLPNAVLPTIPRFRANGLPTIDPALVTSFSVPEGQFGHVSIPNCRLYFHNTSSTNSLFPPLPREYHNPRLLLVDVPAFRILSLIQPFLSVFPCFRCHTIGLRPEIRGRCCLMLVCRSSLCSKALSAKYFVAILCSLATLPHNDFMDFAPFQSLDYSSLPFSHLSHDLFHELACAFAGYDDSSSNRLHRLFSRILRLTYQLTFY